MTINLRESKSSPCQRAGSLLVWSDGGGWRERGNSKLMPGQTLRPTSNRMRSWQSLPLKSMNRLLWDVMMKCSNMMKHPLINKQHGIGGYLSGSPEQPQVPSTRAWCGAVLVVIGVGASLSPPPTGTLHCFHVVLCEGCVGVGIQQPTAIKS
jgi:hypothetical protein